MKIKHVTLWLLIALPFFSSCDNSDNVLAIFTNKTWKLTSIFYDKGNGGTVCEDYWGNEDSKEASMKLLAKENTFTISFTGIEVEDEVHGNYGGYVTSSDLSGSWRANGKSNAFSVSGQDAPAAKEDILGKVFVNALINAYRYEGDSNGNLRIYFKDKNTKRYLLFHVLNK